MCKKSWDKVSSRTIANCFKKAGFIHNLTDLEEESEASEIVNNNQNFLNEIYLQVERTVSFEEYLNIDDNLAICGDYSQEDIINDIINKNSIIEEQDENSDEEIEEPVPSSSEAYENLKKLRRFFEFQEDQTEEMFKFLDVLEDKIVQKKIKNMKQKNISDYLKKK